MPVIISSDQTTTVDASATDTYVIRENVVISNLSGDGIYGQTSPGGSFFQIDGTVRIKFIAILLGSNPTTGGNNEILIGHSANVSSSNFSAITLYAGNNRITNQGNISGLSAIDLLGGNDTVTNSGVIAGGLFGLRCLYNGGLSLSNSGTIQTTESVGLNIDEAAVHIGASSGFIQNTGSILSTSFHGIFSGAGGVELHNLGVVAIDAADKFAFLGTGNDGDQIFNSGRIVGNVQFGDGGNSFAMDAGSVDGDISAGAGADTFQISGGTIRGHVDLGGGNDTLILRGGIVGDGDADIFLSGGEGNDTYKVGARVGTLVEADGGGTDTVRAGISFTLGAHFENLVLTGDDDLSGYGNGLANIITGNAGDNVLKGRGGADTVQGGAGADILDGGADTDIATYAASSAGVTVSLATGRGRGGDADGDRLIGIENLTGSDFADLLTGSRDANVLAGLDGNDRLRGGKGDDLFQFASGSGRDTVLDFQQGKDLLQLSGWGSIDTVFADLKPLMRQQGKDVIIDLDSLVADDAIVLKNTLLKEMTAADFFVI